MKKTIKIISWNVNGLRAVLKKGFHDFLAEHKPDILCLQEVKACELTVPRLEMPFKDVHFHCAHKKGYSGTGLLSNAGLLATYTLFPLEKDNIHEGRVLVGEYDTFYVVSVYTPNAKSELERLDYRKNIWDPAFLEYVRLLEKTKPVIICGDLNVAYQPIDLENPESNRFSPGFTDEEREGFQNFLDAGFVDTFRHFYPNKPKEYSWWSYRASARERNIGWRIDYCLVSSTILDRVQSAFILQDVYGSDHAPVGITLTL